MSSGEDERLNKLVGARIRAARVGAGLSQAEMAERCGVSPPAVSNYEHGRRLISVVFLMRAAAATGLHPAALMAGSDPADLAAGISDLTKRLQQTFRSE